MKKKNRFSIKTKHWVIIMTVICIGLIGLAASSRFSFAPLQQGAGYVISPFQKGINVMGSWLRDQTSGFQDAKKLQKENEELEEKVASWGAMASSRAAARPSVAVPSGYW